MLIRFGKFVKKIEFCRASFCYFFCFWGGGGGLISDSRGNC